MPVRAIQRLLGLAQGRGAQPEDRPLRAEHTELEKVLVDADIAKWQRLVRERDIPLE